MTGFFVCIDHQPEIIHLNPNVMSQNFEAFGHTWNPAIKRPPPLQTAPPHPPILPHYNSSMWNPENSYPEGDLLVLKLAPNSGWVYDINTQQYLPFNPKAPVEPAPDSPNPDGQEWAAARCQLVIPKGKMMDYGIYTTTVKAIGLNNPKASWEMFFRENFNVQLGIQVMNNVVPYNYMTSRTFQVINLGYKNMNPKSPVSWISKQPGGPVITNAQMSMQPWRYDNADGPINWDNMHRFYLDPDKIPASGEVTFAAKWLSEKQPVDLYTAYGAYGSKDFPFEDPGTIHWQSPESALDHVPVSDPTACFFFTLFSWGVPSNRLEVLFAVTNVEMPPFAEAPAGS